MPVLPSAPPLPPHTQPNRVPYMTRAILYEKRIKSKSFWQRRVLHSMFSTGNIDVISNAGPARRAPHHPPEVSPSPTARAPRGMTAQGAQSASHALPGASRKRRARGGATRRGGVPTDRRRWCFRTGWWGVTRPGPRQPPNPTPQILHPKSCTLNPKPETRNPQPFTLNPTLQTLQPKPETRNPNPEPRNPKR